MDDVSDVEITVRGSHRRFHPAERGTVHARVTLEGSAPKAVYDAVVRSAGRAHASVTARHDPSRGPVTWWSAQDVRTWSQRPWNKDGKQLPLVHHARDKADAYAAALGGAGEPDLRLVPEDIEIAAKVDARFVASGG